jgi:uncharacterized protein YgiM (DUF1202 family)
MISRYAPVLRYLASLLGSFAVIAGSFLLLLEVPTSASASAARPDTPTVSALKRAIEPKALPALTARDLDISRSVKVDVRGKAEPQTVPAPAVVASAVPDAATAATVTADAVNLRAFASKTSARVGVVRSGAQVSVLETERSWSRVQTADGHTGWLATRFLAR